MSTPRIRVLRIIARMNVGGPAQQIVGLLDGLDPDRFDHHLAVGRVDDGEADWIALRAPQLAHDDRVTEVASLGRPIDPARDRRAYRELRSLIRTIRPDVVHTHTAKAGLVGRLAAFHEGVPAVVHTFHGHVLHGYFGAGTTAAIRSAERYLARRTQALLSVGDRVRAELLAARIGDPARYVVVPPGVAAPAPHQRAEARRALEVPQTAPVIAFVGRLAGVKRPDRFLAVAERVAAEHPETRFLVAGGATPGDLERLRAAPRSADVRFLGWVGDVGQVYAAADLVVLTSDNEGMPVSLIEAGMCGRAAVATDVGSVGEVVLDGRTGRVVPTDVDAIAAAVSSLLAEPQLLDRYGEAAREHTTQMFGMPRLVATTERVYTDLIRR